MKKTVGVFSLIVMLLSQVFSPFAYAVTGDEALVSEEVEKPVITADEVETSIGETITIENPQREPETPTEDVVVVNSGDLNGTDLNTQNGRGNIEDAHDSAVVVETGVIVEDMSGYSAELSGGNENLEGIGDESKSGIIETIKNFLGLGETKEEEKEEVTYEYETQIITGEAEYDDVKVEVYADTGLFYSGTELVIQAVTGDMYEGVREVLSGQLENISEEEQTVVAFDISFIYSGEEVQPLTGTVQVTFNYENNEELKAAEENEDQEVKVYHLNDIDEEGNKIGELTGTIVEEVVVNEEKSEEENVMVVEAEMFSIYTIVKQVKEEGPESLENQLANFEYGMISIENPNNLGQGITIMDRNLGAQMTGAGAGANPKSYGYHYQWGNNYGFDSSITQLPDEAITENNVNLDGNRVSEYYGRQFVKGNRSWMVYNINKLWQKEDDEGAQGPCPEGWHVPTQNEWINLWNYYNQSFNSGAGGFASYFQIPFAKRRDYVDAKIRLYDAGAYMWSSTPDGALVRYFLLNSSRYYNDYTERGYGLSLRCFKDSYVAPGTFHVITYNFEGGKGSFASMSVEDGMTGTKPVDPKKENAIFLGWYLSGENAEFDFTGTIIKEDITLYAKWEMCEEGYSHVKGICYGNPIFTYDAKGGIFNNGEKIKNIKYNYADEIGIIGTKYSHTPNLDDNGEKDHWDPRNYSNNLNTQAHVVEIPSASKLKVTIKHGIGSINGDWVSMWIGAHPDYTAGDNYSSSIIGNHGKLGGTYSDLVTDIYEVEGDTVTFSFKSAEYGDPVYGNYYGYYAIIEGIDGSKYSTTETVENPTRDGYGFAGWYESGTDTMVNVVQEIIPQEIVTDKRFYAKWLENEKEVTFNANGGYFKTGNSQTSEITIKFNRQDSYYIPDIGIQIPSKLSSDMEVQSGWMFAGWYTENGLNGDWGEELNIGKPQTNYVYAKWLPFDDFEVKMGDVKFTIMDRNMGAEEVAEGIYGNRENSNKLGYYYQWGNNYGFSNDGLILNSGAEMISNPNYETNPWGPGNYYYNNIFIKPERPIGRWDTENNKNLWGGENSINSDEDKQGPCPEGYHVPSYSDWNAVIQSFEKIKSSECNGILNQKCFAIKLKLPFAGLINSTANVLNQGYIGYYWSSSPFNDEKSSKYLFIPTYTTIKLQEIERASGLSVRCFKNSSATITFFNDDGELIEEKKGIKWYDRITKTYEPEMPIKEGYGFKGRYDENGNEFVFSNNTYLNHSIVLTANREKNTEYVFDANGGEYDDGEKEKNIEVTIKNGVLTLNEQLPKIRKEKTSYIGDDGKTYYTGWMFAGWYTTSGNGNRSEQTEEWIGQKEGITTETKRVYAKRLPFEDLDLGVIGLLGVKIMDRNMGAEEVAEGIYGNSENSNKLGYYYQWGNNYGFKNNGVLQNSDISDSNNNYRVDGDEYGPNNYYYGTIFKKIQSSPYRWTVNINKNLWGGEVSTNSDEDKQGPCPEGYHVPDVLEWKAINIALNKLDTTECSEMGIGRCLALKLKLPFAGYRDYYNSDVYSQGWGGYYWSSSPNLSSDNVYNLNISDTYTNPENLRYNVYGHSVRCFKNSPKYSLVFMLENGERIVYDNLNWFDVITESYKPEDQIRDNAKFIGWKEINSNEIFEFGDNTIINGDISLYPEYECNIGYIESTDGKTCEKFGINYFSDNKLFRTIFPDIVRTETPTTGIVHTANLDDEGNFTNENIGKSKTIIGLPFNYDISTYNTTDYLINRQDLFYIPTSGEQKIKLNIKYGGTPDVDCNNPGAIVIWTGDISLLFENTLDPEKVIQITQFPEYGTTNTIKHEIQGDGFTILQQYNCPNYGFYITYAWTGLKETITYKNKNLSNLGNELNKEGYTFGGWYYTGLETEFNPETVSTGEIVNVYSKWNPNHYTIHFSEGNIDDIYATYGEEIILPNLTKKGYTFKGWQAEDGRIYNDSIQEGTGLTIEDGVNVTLTAKWENVPEKKEQTSSAGGGGKVVETKVIQQEHNSAELTGTTKEIEVEQVKPQPTKTNTTKESTKQESLTTQSTTSQSQIDPEILTAYEWAKSKDITTIQTLDEAMPDGVVKRGHLAKMVVNYATNILGREIPEKIPSECRWNDNRKDWESEEIKDYAVKSCALGLMGLDMPKFLPNMEVTRAQFGTIISRLLWGKKYAGGTPYYRKHLNALKENNIMTQIENPEKRIELRQWVWLMLMRSAENK